METWGKSTKYRQKATGISFFRVYQKWDNFSIELEPRGRIMSQTSLEL